MQQSIPVLNLNHFSNPANPTQKEAFINTLGDALKDIGFFALENHGVDSDLITNAYNISKDLFDLKEDAKKSYENKEVGQRGFISFGREKAKDSTAPDLKEFWHVGRELEQDHPLLSKFGTNVWPTELPEFKPTMLTLFKQLEACSMQLLSAVSTYLDLEKDALCKDAEFGDNILRIINYPPIPRDKNPNSVRAAAHEDINLITLLCESTAAGLELLERDGSWRKIHALKGQIIVDSGDMLQNLSNGLLKSTTHRVVNPDNDREQRFSMPFFVHPRGEVSLNPKEHLIERTGGEKKYPDMTAGQYLDQRLREIGLTK